MTRSKFKAAARVLGGALAGTLAACMAGPAWAYQPSSDIHVPAYCSHLAARAYARSSNDSAETIAAASFEKCRCLWAEAMTAYVDEHRKKTEASSNEAALTVDGMLDGYKKDSIRVLSVVVFDTRAESKWESISDEKAADNLRQIDELIDGCKARSVK
jgi:hypothetical protein